MQTVEAIIDENGEVRLLENIKLPEARKAVLTILDDAPQKISAKQSLAEKWSNNQEFLKAMSEAYADDDTEEKEFLRSMQIKQMQILDEWK
jgi:hypothetical protein